MGKGKGNRVFNHVKLAQNENFDSVTDKTKIIQDILNAGLEVIVVIHRHGMTEEVAIEVESALIDAYPYSTNIMNGTGNNEFGIMHVKDVIAKYKAEEANLQHKVVMITINNSIQETDIYNATRYAWRLNKDRANQADYILAVSKGIIKSVFTAQEWKEATKENFPEFNRDEPNRYGFVGEKALPEIQQLYINKRIPAEYTKKGASNPIKYNF